MAKSAKDEQHDVLLIASSAKLSEIRKVFVIFDAITSYAIPSFVPNRSCFLSFPHDCQFQPIAHLDAFRIKRRCLAVIKSPT